MRAYDRWTPWGGTIRIPLKQSAPVMAFKMISGDEDCLGGSAGGTWVNVGGPGAIRGRMSQ